MSAPLVEIAGLTVDFEKDGRSSRAVEGGGLPVAPGEALGIVGESGSGKSVTWLAALGLLPARARVQGSVRIDKQQLIGAAPKLLESVRGKPIAMIFQDPSSCLNPVHRTGCQPVEALSLHRALDGAAAEAAALRLLDQVGIADAKRRLGDYPHQLSGGLNQRVMVAMGLAGEAVLLGADGAAAAGGGTIQPQILALLGSIRRDTGMALVLISHDLGVVAENVNRVAVMYAGRLVEEAMGQDLFGAARHPYTQGLLAALPTLSGPRRRLAAIPGTVPEPGKAPPGCSSAPRCPLAEPRCQNEPPPVRRVGLMHRAACHLQIDVGFSAWNLAKAAE